jgi:hypothetical protein
VRAHEDSVASSIPEGLSVMFGAAFALSRVYHAADAAPSALL